MEGMSLGWEETIALCKGLAKKAAGCGADLIVGISRGGLVPARVLSDELGIRQVAVVGIEAYRAPGLRMDTPRISQGLDIPLEGRRILLVDDISDSGRSLIAAKGHISERGAENVIAATLHHNPGSKCRPDIFMQQTRAWVIYPWEKEETRRAMAAELI